MLAVKVVARQRKAWHESRKIGCGHDDFIDISTFYVTHVFQAQIHRLEREHYRYYPIAFGSNDQNFVFFDFDKAFLTSPLFSPRLL